MSGEFSSDFYNLNFGSPLRGLGFPDGMDLSSFSDLPPQIDFYRTIESCFLAPNIANFYFNFQAPILHFDFMGQDVNKNIEKDLYKPTIFSTAITTDYFSPEIGKIDLTVTGGDSTKKEGDSASAVVASTKGAAYQPNIDTSEYNTYNDIILKYAKQYNVDPNFVKAVIKQESRFIPTAGSGAGAKGLMQLMPKTARSYGVSNVYDPEQNIKAGVKMLSDLLKKYDGNLENVLAAYNWGMGNLALEAAGKKVRPLETKRYVPAVLGFYREYSNA